MRNQFTCNNGLIFSLQTTRTHYCTPRNDKGPWTHVEIGFPSRKVESLMPYADGAWRDCPPTDDVYAYVPMDVVQKMIDDNGGLIEQNLSRFTTLKLGSKLHIFYSEI